MELAQLNESSNSVCKINEGNSTAQQKTYLGGQQFVFLHQGEYFLHVRISEGPSQQESRLPLNIVLYSPVNAAIRPILSASKAQQMKNAMLLQEYTDHLEDVIPSARGRSLSTKTVCTGQRILLVIANHEESSRRAKMTLLSQNLSFEDHQHQSERILQLSGRSEQLVSLLLKDPRTKPDSRYPCYEIRVIP